MMAITGKPITHPDDLRERRAYEVLYGSKRLCACFQGMTTSSGGDLLLVFDMGLGENARAVPWKDITRIIWLC